MLSVVCLRRLTAQQGRRSRRRSWQCRTLAASCCCSRALFPPLVSHYLQPLCYLRDITPNFKREVISNPEATSAAKHVIYSSCMWCILHLSALGLTGYAQEDAAFRSLAPYFASTVFLCKCLALSLVNQDPLACFSVIGVPSRLHRCRQDQE